MFAGIFSNVVNVLAAIVILGVIVMAHEFGHYLMGRLTGIGVLEFSVGFGPRVLGWTRNNIKYSLRAIPLGGFCKFAGVEDGQADRPDAMEKQPVWKRFLTVFAGPFMNFVLALLAVYLLLTAVGLDMVETVPTVASVHEDMPAQAAGFQAGDAIVALEGEEIQQGVDGVIALQEYISANNGNELHFTLLRDGERIDVSVMPEMASDGETVRPLIGITFDVQKVGTYRYGLLKAIPESWNYLVEYTGLMLKTLRDLIFRGQGLNDVTGPVGIISYMSAQVREGWGMIMNLVFLLSLNLGIMNLLPLPSLDGGRLVFLIVEAIRRKPVPPQKEGMVHAIGLLLLFGLIIVITFKDVIALFSR